VKTERWAILFLCITTVVGPWAIFQVAKAMDRYAAEQQAATRTPDYTVMRLMRCRTDRGFLEVWVSNTGVITARCNEAAADAHPGYPDLSPPLNNYGRIVVHEMEIPLPPQSGLDPTIHASIGADIMQETVTTVPVWAR